MLPMSSPHQMIHNLSLILFIHTPSNPHTPCNDLITNYMLWYYLIHFSNPHEFLTITCND